MKFFTGGFVRGGEVVIESTPSHLCGCLEHIKIYFESSHMFIIHLRIRIVRSNVYYAGADARFDR